MKGSSCVGAGRGEHCDVFSGELPHVSLARVGELLVEAHGIRHFCLKNKNEDGHPRSNIAFNYVFNSCLYATFCPSLK